MQPVRKVLTATHFKYLEDVKKWTPCSPGDPDAQEKSWTDIESDELQEPGLRVADFLKSVDNVRPTVTAEDLKKHDQWTLESGEPGNAAVITTLVPQAQTNAAYRERGIMKMKNAVSPYIVPLRTYRSFDWFWNGLFPIVQLVVEAGLFQSVREGAMGPVCLLRANFFLCDPVRAPMVMLILQWVGRERQGTAQTTRSALPARSARTASLDAPYGRLGRCFPHLLPISCAQLRGPARSPTLLVPGLQALCAPDFPPRLTSPCICAFVTAWSPLSQCAQHRGPARSPGLLLLGLEALHALGPYFPPRLTPLRSIHLHHRASCLSITRV